MEHLGSGFWDRERSEKWFCSTTRSARQGPNAPRRLSAGESGGGLDDLAEADRNDSLEDAALHPHHHAHDVMDVLIYLGANNRSSNWSITHGVLSVLVELGGAGLWRTSAMG